MNNQDTINNNQDSILDINHNSEANNPSEYLYCMTLDHHQKDWVINNQEKLKFYTTEEEALDAGLCSFQIYDYTFDQDFDKNNRKKVYPCRTYRTKSTIEYFFLSRIPIQEIYKDIEYGKLGKKYRDFAFTFKVIGQNLEVIHLWKGTLVLYPFASFKGWNRTRVSQMTRAEINTHKYQLELNKRSLPYKDRITYFKIIKMLNHKHSFWKYHPAFKMDILDYTSIYGKEKNFYQRVLLAKLPKVVNDYYGQQGVDKIKPSQLPMVLMEDKWFPSDNQALKDEAEAIFGKKTNHGSYPLNYLEEPIEITTTWHVYITGFDGQYNYFFEEYDPNNLFRACAERNITLTVN